GRHADRTLGRAPTARGPPPRGHPVVHLRAAIGTQHHRHRSLRHASTSCSAKTASVVRLSLPDTRPAGALPSLVPRAIRTFLGARGSSSRASPWGLPRRACSPEPVDAVSRPGIYNGGSPTGTTERPSRTNPRRSDRPVT